MNLHIPVHWSTLMVTQGGKHCLIGKKMVHQLYTLFQDVQLVLSRLVPHIVRWQITRPVDPIELHVSCKRDVQCNPTQESAKHTSSLL